MTYILTSQKASANTAKGQINNVLAQKWQSYIQKAEQSHVELIWLQKIGTTNHENIYIRPKSGGGHFNKVIWLHAAKHPVEYEMKSFSQCMRKTIISSTDWQQVIPHLSIIIKASKLTHDHMGASRKCNLKVNYEAEKSPRKNQLFLFWISTSVAKTEIMHQLVLGLHLSIILVIR